MNYVKIKIARILKKIMKMHRFFLKNVFLFCMHKMANISRKTWRKNGVEVIVFNGKKWLNEKHVEKQLEHSNLAAVTNQYSSELKKQRQELQNWGKYQSCRKFLEEGLAVQIIMDCRTTPTVNFKT